MIQLLLSWFGARAVVILVTVVVFLVALLLTFLLHRLYFIILPQWAVKKYQRANPERLRRYLEFVVATPSLVGPVVKLVVRGKLVGIYLPQGRHAEAAAHCRAKLASLEWARGRHKLDFPALEADARRRLADCLDGLGQTQEAEHERRLAEACVERAPGDTVRHLTQGTLLGRQHRYAEACTAFEQALSYTSESDRPVRIECMSHLVLACFNAGRPVECLKWAEQMIALGAEGLHLRVAHQMASVACGNFGRLDESEGHCRRAYEVAAALGDAGVMGEILSNLASIQSKRGKLAEAYEACAKAAAMDPKAERMALGEQSQILRAWGRYDEAIELLNRYDKTPKLVIPAYERRIRAVFALDTSRIEAECGRADDAWTHIQEAKAVLANDAKLGLKCEGAEAWVFAARGLAEESRRVAGEVEARLIDFEKDPSTCRGVMYDLGMAACTRGDHEAGEKCFSRYLELSPDPVHQPTALYFRGECRRQRGDTAGALADFRAAVAMNIDSHYARLASRGLGEMVGTQA
jgi:tetratricopeptide (TPR) repeat protein